jgi:hypothetical protein
MIQYSLRSLRSICFLSVDMCLHQVSFQSRGIPRYFTSLGCVSCCLFSWTVGHMFFFQVKVTCTDFVSNTFFGTGLEPALRLRMKSKITHWGPIYPSVKLLVRDPILHLTQDGWQSFEWSYSKCDIPSSVSDQSVIQIVLCVYNYMCFWCFTLWNFVSCILISYLSHPL